MRYATRAVVSTMGAIMGLAGLEHGLGEVLQGNVAPRGIMFPSWPDSDFFRIVAGEPAMSIVPNLLVTGILTIAISLIFALWAIWFAQRRNGGLVLILLAIIMLLVGGGIFPPILGVILGAVGTCINQPLAWRRTNRPSGLSHILADAWPALFGICLISWLCLFPGLNLFGYFLGVNDANLTVMVICLALGSLALTIVSGLVRDAQQI